MKKNNSRREFIQKAALAGTGLFVANNVAFAETINETPIAEKKNLKSKGFAARDSSGKLSAWEFERRQVGDDEIVIDIKFSGVCHSDIHTVRGEWGSQQYPLVPGHEIAGIVSAVGINVRGFKVGDKAGVGCMVDSCGTCDSCIEGQEQHCDKGATVMTYGTASKQSPTGITQGGYSNNIVVKESFAIKIPENLPLKEVAPLLCAGVTTYSPLMKVEVNSGMKIGVAGIGGLGHMAVKIAVSKGAEVLAFTTSSEKVDDIKAFGAKEVVVVDSIDKLAAYKGTLDFMISSIPASYDLGAYVSLVKPGGTYTQVGLPAKDLSFNNFSFVANGVNFNGSLIGGIPETQEVINYCAIKKIYPTVETIDPAEINEVYEKIIAKQARYRYVIDAEKF